MNQTNYQHRSVTHTGRGNFFLVVAMGVLFLNGVTLSALADGGTGGSVNGGSAGGAGGTGFGGNPGQTPTGNGGGGGGGGAGGGSGAPGAAGGNNVGSGGQGGSGGANGTTATSINNTSSLTGDDGGAATSGGGGNVGGGGGGGGAGGYGAVVTGSATTNSNTLAIIAGGKGGSGGAGGTGGTAGSNGGKGGDGGVGVIFTGNTVTFISNGTITGGTGGVGGNGATGTDSFGFAGAGGNGGVGLIFSGTGSTLTNRGTITGGNGNLGGMIDTGPVGLGGVGVTGAGLTIINSETISGGMSGDGTTQADAIDFTGGANTLTLQNGSMINGAISVIGSVNFNQTTQQSLFNVITGTGSVIDSGAGRLSLVGTNTYSGGTTVNGGVLIVTDDSNLGAVSGGVNLTGGGELLTFGLGDFTSSRAITVGTTAGDTGTLANLTVESATYTGPISGAGILKIGDTTNTGEITLSSSATTFSELTLPDGGVALASNQTLALAGYISNTTTTTGAVNFSGANQQTSVLTGGIVPNSASSNGSTALFIASAANETATGGITSGAVPITVKVSNLTITGGVSQGGVGGGAGLGGGVFAGTGAVVTLSNVNLTGNSALGGIGGSSVSNGGGGIGGNGGGGFGGGGGLFANGSSSGNGGGANGGTSSSPNGGFGGGGYAQNQTGVGGAGGFGSGGGASASGENAGAGGFGGGGGGTSEGDSGGQGGFGGGGGATGSGIFPAGPAGQGGFGGGNASSTTDTYDFGGGAGLGGAIFVQNGATVILTGNDAIHGNTVTGGSAVNGDGGNAGGGAAAGSDIFMMSGSTVNLAPGTSHTVSIGTAADDASGVVSDVADDSTYTAATFASGTSSIGATSTGAALTIGSSTYQGGLVQLHGNNTYAGGTIITNGTTLEVFQDDNLGATDAAKASIGAITLTGASELLTDDANTGGFTTSRTVTVGNSSSDSGILAAANGTSATYNSTISGPGGLQGGDTTGNDNGTVILTGTNTYLGSTTVVSGVLQANSNGALSNGAVTVDSGATLGLSGTLLIGNSLTISGTGSNSQGAIYASGDTANPQTTITGTVTLAGNATVGDQTGANILLTLRAINLGTNTLTVGTGSGHFELDGTITGTGGLNIVTGGSSGGAYITGGNNSFNGLTDVEANSQLALLDTGGTAISGNLTIEGGAMVNDNEGNQLALSTVLTLNGGGATFSIVNAATTPASISETLAGLNGATGSVITAYSLNGPHSDSLILKGSGSYSYAGQISDFSGTVGSATLGLTMDGTGTQVLSGYDTYTGGTTLQAGVLQAGSIFALGAGPVSFTGGTLQYGTGITQDFSDLFSTTANQLYSIDTNGNNVTFAVPLTSSGGSLTKLGAGTLTLTGPNTYSGGTTVSGGTLQGDTTSLQGNILDNAQVVFDQDTDGTYAGLLSGNGSLIKDGTGTVTFGNNNTYTGGTTINAGMLIVSGSTVAANAFSVNAGTLNVTGNVMGSVTVANGAFLTGTGTTGATTINGGGHINLQDGIVSSLTVQSLTIGGTTTSSLSLDIQTTGGVTTLDHITDNGALVLNNSTVINVAALAGTTSLTDGSYALLSFGSITGSLADLSLSTNEIDGVGLTLQQVGDTIYLVVASPTTYDLGASAGASRVISGGTVSVTATITNTGTGGADSLSYTGLTTSGSPTGGLPKSGGPVANNGGTDSGTGTINVGTTTGIRTITPTVTSATNTNIGTDATLGNTTSTTVDVVANRVVTATSVDFGRVMVGQGVSSSSTLSTTGDDADFTRVTVGQGSANGVSTSGGNNTLFNSASATDTRTVSGSFATAGNTSGSFTLGTTGEGLAGEQPINVSLSYSADAVNNRTESATSVDLGRLLVGQTSGNQSTTVSSVTNEDDLYTRTTLLAGSQDSSVTDGTITLNNASSYTYGGANDAVNSTTAGITGSFTSAGEKSGSANFSLQGEGLAGEQVNPLAVNYTADAVSQRVIINGATTDLGVFHNGATVDATSTAFITSGSHDTTTDVSVAAGSGVADANGIALSGGPTTFDGTLNSDTRTLSGTIVNNTGGVTSGSFNLAVTTLENGGAGLTGEGPYSDVNVAYSAFVYTGQGVWNTNGSGSWGAVSATPANWTANGGTPGLDAGFTSTDSATFGGALTEGSAAVTLNGDNPSLNAITFNDANGSYIIAQGTGGSLTLNGGAGSANITVEAGAQFITAPIILATATNLNVAANQQLTLSGQISGSPGLTLTSAGTTVLSGPNTYSGGTTINAGLLGVGNATALGTGDVTLTSGTLTTAFDNHVINVGGNYTQGVNGTLVLNITSSTVYDKLNLSGSGVASLNGNLVLNIVGNFAPGSGSTFTVITTNNPIEGTFNSITTNLPSIGLVTNYTDDLTVLFQKPFVGLLGNTLTPNERAIASYIDAHDLPPPTPGFTRLVGALNSISGDPTALANAFNGLSTLNFGSFTSSTAFNNASFLTQQFDSYLANHRGADGTFVSSAGGLDDSGLVVNDPNVDPGLQMVHSRLLAWSPAPSTGLLSDTPTMDLSGTDMKDTKSLVASTEPPNLWNVFISGNVVLAQNFSDASAGLSHSDATTGGVQVGADYKITPHFLVGAMFGYGHTSATLDNLGSNATVDTYSPTLYASYTEGGWYANAMGSYGFANYSQDRNVSIGTFGGTAHSSPSGDQIIGNLDGGYDFHHQGWTFGPTLGVQYTHLEVDGYTESGLPGADLAVNQNEADSLRSGLGGHVSYAFSGAGVEFTPHLSASWQHEFMDQSRGITSQFDGVGGGSFVVKTANPSRESALIDVGLDAQVNKTLTVFTDYTVNAGQSNYFGQSVEAGVKIGF